MAVSVPGEAAAPFPLLSVLPLAVVVHDAQGRVIAHNARAEGTLGLAAEQLTGAAALPAGWTWLREDGTPLAPDEHPLYGALATRQMTGHALLGLRRGNGEVSWLSAGIGLHFDAAGALVHALVTYDDVTRRITAERALSDSETRYRTLFDSMDAAVLVMRGPACVSCNPATVKMFGVDSVADVLGKTPLDFAPKTQPDGRDSAQVVQENIALAMQNGSYAFEWHTLKKSGEPMVLEVRFTPFVVGGEPLFQCIALDVTARHRAAQAQRRAQELEALGVLAGGLAHDFNNQLQAAFGFLSLARKAAERGERDEALGEVEEALRRSAKLAGQLLTFSRGGNPVKKVTPLGPLLDSAAHVAVGGTPVELLLELEPGLWSVDADAGQLAQALQNVVMNAGQAMPRGGAVTVRARNVTGPTPSLPWLPEGRHAVITVSDTGEGIPQDVVPRIFEPYFTTRERSSGLGLAVAWSVVRSHGGVIDVQSAQGRGTTIAIALPASARALPEAAQPVPGRTRPARILVMDDDALVRKAVGGLLVALGHTVELAPEGLTAVERFRAAKVAGLPFDVVVLDLTVRGGLGGVETLELLRHEDAQVKAVVSSGYSDTPAIAEHQRFGFAAVLPKPYTVELLQQVLASVLPA